MWTRANLKRRGKIAYKSNFWRSVVAAFLLAVAVSGNVSFSSVTLSDAQLEMLLSNATTVMLMQLLRAAAPGIILTVIIFLFLLMPITVGCRRFFLLNAKVPAKIGECVYFFRHNYWNVVMVMFIRQLYLLLWSCLFFIPGVIKAYSYRMVPYILAEHPDMPASEVITKSRQMMRGHKWNAFLLDLSFLGWEILSIFTLGILDLLFTQPYRYASDAELYLVLNGDASDHSHYGAGGPDGSGGRYGDGRYGGGGYDDGGYYDEPDPHDEY